MCLVFLVLSARAVNSLRNCQLANEELSTYKKDEFPSLDKNVSGTLKSIKEKHKILHKVLLILALIRTCMVTGDGVLTPALSGKYTPLGINLILLFTIIVICICFLSDLLESGSLYIRVFCMLLHFFRPQLRLD